jgi:hypothetical protein
MRQGREADHSPPTIAEIKKNVDLYIHSPYAFMAKGQLYLLLLLYVYLLYDRRVIGK